MKRLELSVAEFEAWLKAPESRMLYASDGGRRLWVRADGTFVVEVNGVPVYADRYRVNAIEAFNNAPRG